MTAFAGHSPTDPLVELASRAASDDIAVATNHHGVSGGPTSPVAGELWADNLVGTRLKMRNAAEDGWLDLAPLSSDVTPMRFSAGVAAPSSYVRVGFAPAAVLVTCELVHSNEGERDTRGVLFSRTTGVGEVVVVTLQANDEDLGSTALAIAEDPRFNRPQLRCVFREDGFFFSRAGRVDLGESFRYAAFGRGF